MTGFFIGQTLVRFHPLLLMMLPLSALLGMRQAIWPIALSLAVHEAAHLVAARLMRVRVTELTLLPFGGAARLGNLYALSPGQLLTIAAAGPAASLALALTAAALAQWRWLSPALALTLTRVNLSLMLFNLCPALPLDGGRMLYALTARRLGRDRAAAIGIAAGRGLAAFLLLAMPWGGMAAGRINLSLPACAVFILASLGDERKALCDLSAVTLLNALSRPGAPVEMRLCAVSADCGAMAALRRAAPDAATLYAVYRDGALSAFVDDRQLLSAALDSPAARVGDAPSPIWSAARR